MVTYLLIFLSSFLLPLFFGNFGLLFWRDYLQLSLVDCYFFCLFAITTPKKYMSFIQSRPAQKKSKRVCSTDGQDLSYSLRKVSSPIIAVKRTSIARDGSNL